MTILAGSNSGGSNVPNRVLDYDEVIGLGASTPATVATFTAPSVTRIHSIIGSGQNYACYRIKINTDLIAFKRSGPSRNVEFFLNVELQPADVLTVEVEHSVTGEIADFEASILGF